MDKTHQGFQFTNRLLQRREDMEINASQSESSSRTPEEVSHFDLYKHLSDIAADKGLDLSRSGFPTRTIEGAMSAQGISAGDMECAISFCIGADLLRQVRGGFCVTTRGVAIYKGMLQRLTS